jgi:uncharacterized protein YuzE
MDLRVRFDRVADAAYIYLCDIEPASVAKTIVCDDLPVNLDVDQQGKLVGIEILSAARTLPTEIIETAERA